MDVGQTINHGNIISMATLILVKNIHTFFNNTAMRSIISAEFDYFSSQVPSFHCIFQDG